MCHFVHHATRKRTKRKHGRKMENAKFALIDTMRSANFCFSSNKDKSATRTNDIRDRSFQPKRTARHVRAFFLPDRLAGRVQCTGTSGEDRCSSIFSVFYTLLLLYRSPRLFFPIVISRCPPFSLFSVPSGEYIRTG